MQSYTNSCVSVSMYGFIHYTDRFFIPCIVLFVDMYFIKIDICKTKYYPQKKDHKSWRGTVFRLHLTPLITVTFLSQRRRGSLLTRPHYACQHNLVLHPSPSDMAMHTYVDSLSLHGETNISPVIILRLVS